MGLDMYLTAKRFMWSTDDKDKELGNEIKKLINADYRVQYIELEVGYWRKANQIHKWFVDNIQEGNDDCGTYYVSEEQLNKLLKTVNKTLKSDSPGTILPTKEGFFFGSTEYDQYYKDDLKDTKEIIEKYLAFPDKDKYELYYHSSW